MCALQKGLFLDHWASHNSIDLWSPNEICFALSWICLFIQLILFRQGWKSLLFCPHVENKTWEPKWICVTRAPVLNFMRSWVALSFKVCGSVSQSGMRDTLPNLHFLQYIKAWVSSTDPVSSITNCYPLIEWLNLSHSVLLTKYTAS